MFFSSRGGYGILSPLKGTLNVPENDSTSGIATVRANISRNPSRPGVIGSALRAAISGQEDPAYYDPAVQSWMKIFQASMSVPKGPGILGHYPESPPIAPRSGGSGGNPEVAFAGTLIDRRYDETIPETHCTYERPGMSTYTVRLPGYVKCPETTPAPRG